MKILVWKGKHDDQYFDASTPEKLEAASLKILRELWDYGLVYEVEAPIFTPDEEELLALTEDEMNSFPDSIRKDVEMKRSQALRRVEENQEVYKAFSDLKSVLDGTPNIRVWRTKARYTDEQWAKCLEVASSREWEVTDTEIKRPLTAHDLIMERNGGEYEVYQLIDVVDATQM